MSTSELIQPHHLRRNALIYIRQSSAQQVVNHQESLKLQYARANAPASAGEPGRDPGIGCDLGLATSTASGHGFELVAPVSRSARSASSSYGITRRPATVPTGTNYSTRGCHQCLIIDPGSTTRPRSTATPGVEGQISSWSCTPCRRPHGPVCFTRPAAAKWH